jgi:hypothetical protein
MGTTPDYAATTLEAAQANTLAAIRAQVANLNEQLKSGYLSRFHDWAVNFAPNVAVGVPNADAPKPPNGYVVGYFNDPTSGPGTLGPYGDKYVQWAYPAVGPMPVCDMPPIPGVVAHPAGFGKIGSAIPGGNGIWFQALEGDTTPIGQATVLTSADGVTALFVKVGSSMGAGVGWFQKIG